MNKKSNKPTIYDIANLAGVSTSTVSRTLRDEGYSVSDETKRKVLDAAIQLNYIFTKQIDEINRNKIAVIMPNIINPYYATLITGVEHIIQESGMQMILYNTNGNKEREKKISEEILDLKVQGVIIVSIADTYEHIQKLIDLNVKVVACEQKIGLECNSVTFNFFEGGLMATDYLISKGKKKIAFLSSPLDRYSRTELLNGYKKSLKRNNIKYDENLVRIADKEANSDLEMFEFTNGKDLIKDLIDEKIEFDSVFCVNDVTAIGVIQELKYRGIMIPEEIGVIGFDNIYFSNMIYPPLTTIDQSTYELGTLVAEILLGSINNPKRNNFSTVLEPKLIIRESV